MEVVRRGYVPKDIIEFGPKATEKLNAAAQELLFLMDRGYDTKSASTFVGNHHLLSERQRMALARIVSTTSAVQGRKQKELLQAPDSLALDGFNIPDGLIQLSPWRWPYPAPYCWRVWTAPSGTWRGCGAATGS